MLQNRHVSPRCPACSPDVSTVWGGPGAGREAEDTWGLCDFEGMQDRTARASRFVFCFSREVIKHPGLKILIGH